MYNGGKILIGLLIFVGLVTFPYWNNFGKATVKPEPKLDTPEIMKLPESERKCVEATSFMKTEHMKLLNEWRDWVVRNGEGTYANAEGKRYSISLQNTCMKCHSNKKQFCDQCHNYTDVSPYCWDCHIAPKEKEL